jgi:nitroreductase
MNPLAEVIPAKAGKELVYQSEIMLDLIRKRRTIRQFTVEDVSQEQVETLLEMAMCAPNRLDRRPWHFVVIRDKEIQKKITDLGRTNQCLMTAPVVIAVCGLPQVSSTWLMDVSAATQNLVLAATAMGLGAAWIGNPGDMFWDRCEELLLDALAIPHDHIGIGQKLLLKWDRLLWGGTTRSLNRVIHIPALVAVGHPAQELPPHGRDDRFDATRVHYGRW